MAVLLTALCLLPGATCLAQSAPSPAIAKFALSYERGGGLIGETRSLRIAPGRHATVKARGKTVRFRVSVDRVRRLRKALERADFANMPNPRPSSCADCFYYDINYRRHSVEFSQLDQPPALTGVVDQLEAMAEAHLPFH